MNYIKAQIDTLLQQRAALDTRIRQARAQYIRDADSRGQSRTTTANELGISRATLYQVINHFQAQENSAVPQKIVISRDPNPDLQNERFLLTHNDRKVAVNFQGFPEEGDTQLFYEAKAQKIALPTKPEEIA